VDWWEDVVVRDTPYFKNGYFTIEDKPGYGIELNPDVVKAHLALGETWWG
jgi:L-alanine-DL-glutamate epimerase-like enolase superfamily enzyme